MEKPNDNALSCYRYTALTPQAFVFEFCENGYRGVNLGEFRHQGDYESKSVVSEWQSVVTEVLAANPGFPDTMPDKSAAAPAKLEHQDVTTDIRFEGEIIGSAAFCMGNMGLLSDEEAGKVGTTYIKWLRMKYGNAYMDQFFYIFKDALIAGEKAQQKRGMQDCDKRIAAFEDLAKVIGYERPHVSPRK